VKNTVVKKKKPQKIGEKFVVVREFGRTFIVKGGNTIKRFVPPTV
jgi:hypothetical protein